MLPSHYYYFIFPWSLIEGVGQSAIDALLKLVDRSIFCAVYAEIHNFVQPTGSINYSVFRYVNIFRENMHIDTILKIFFLLYRSSLIKHLNLLIHTLCPNKPGQECWRWKSEFKINFIQYKVIVKFLSVVFAKAITMVLVGGFQNKVVRYAALWHFQSFPDGYYLTRCR